MGKYLIIGGSSGIGKATVKKLIDEGHQVWATYRSTTIETNSNVKTEQLDVLEEEIDMSFLPDSLDGVVYCPGSINLKPFTRISPNSFVDDYKLQVVGAVKVLQKAMPALKASEKSSIVFFSTVAVQNGFNFHSLVASSKGAIEGLTRSLAAELAPTIRVNCIAPSLTDTPLAETLLRGEEKKKANAERHPLKKIGSTNDIAEAVSYLLTDKSDWMTGQILHIDGGMSSIRG